MEWPVKVKLMYGFDQCRRTLRKGRVTELEHNSQVMKRISYMYKMDKMFLPNSSSSYVW